MFILWEGEFYLLNGNSVDMECGGRPPRHMKYIAPPFASRWQSSALGLHAVTVASDPSKFPPFISPTNAGIASTWLSSVPLGGPTTVLASGNVTGIMVLEPGELCHVESGRERRSAINLYACPYVVYKVAPVLYVVDDEDAHPLPAYLSYLNLLGFGWVPPSRLNSMKKADLPSGMNRRSGTERRAGDVNLSNGIHPSLSPP